MMDGTWEHLIRQARLEPAARRENLYRQLLSKPTYVVHVGPAGRPETEIRSAAGVEFSLWADQDSAFGGVWVPVFSSPEKVAEYVQIRRVEAPAGQELYWMAHEPGRVYDLLESIDCFAGIRLDPCGDGGVSVLWPEVNALSEGRVPPEAPFRFELPLEELHLPRDAKIALAPMDPQLTGNDGQQAFFPEVGEPEPEELRSLVALRVGPESAEQDDVAWAPCRHFALALKSWLESEKGKAGKYADALVRSLIAFEMYGEAEALCLWLSEQDGNEAFAWIFLSAVYGRTGRLDSCAKLCERGMHKYKKERAFYLNQARAYAQLDDRMAAQESARRGLAHFPGDAALLRFL
ncbi:MAG: hypothetical protein HY553_17620 [Elusimicrobia bacterium]|nr:hypothetical protein [Elusimicrobiota bacterium]